MEKSWYPPNAFYSNEHQYSKQYKWILSCLLISPKEKKSRKFAENVRKLRWVSQHQPMFLRIQTFCASPNMPQQPWEQLQLRHQVWVMCSSYQLSRPLGELPPPKLTSVDPPRTTVPKHLFSRNYWDKHIGPIYHTLRVNSSSSFRARCRICLVTTTLETSPLCLCFFLMKSHTCSWLIPILEHF